MDILITEISTYCAPQKQFIQQELMFILHYGKPTHDQ